MINYLEYKQIKDNNYTFYNFIYIFREFNLKVTYVRQARLPCFLSLLN